MGIINMVKIKGNFVSEMKFVKVQKFWKVLCEVDVFINLQIMLNC